MITQQCPIGVFDSGVGGISTLRTLSSMLPNEDFVFYGDSANAPYGEKSADEVYELTEHAVEKLHALTVKAIVIACNTATSAAKPELMKRYPDIVFLGIEPAVKQAVDEGKKNILVMATPLTLSLQKFHTQMEKYCKRATITPLPCPRLAELIEKGPAALAEIKDYIAGLLASVRPESGEPYDAAVLGCTHYPFVTHTISQLVGPNATIYTGFDGLGRNLKRQLGQRSLLRDTGNQAHHRNVRFMSSRDTAEELSLYRRLYEHGFEG